ncbi:MAG: transposase [Cyanobacteriota bacterium]
MVTRRTTFRLYPIAAQEKVLHQWRKLHCLLYNSAVADRKFSYQKLGRSVGYLEQQNRLPEFKEVWPEYKVLGSHALQATLKRVDFAFQRFFKGLSRYPKFKSSRRYSGWTYPCSSGWKAHTTGKHGALSLSNLGSIPMRGEARQWGQPTTCTICYRSGKWYASITVECEVVRETGTGAIGIDMGCLTAIACSNGEKIANPRFASNSKIRQVQRQLSRKKKFSRRWKRVQKRVAKLHRQVANRRQDWVHQQAAQIVSSNSLVATEKLEIPKMTRKAKVGSKRKRQKTGLNRSILDVGWGMLRSAIAYKLAEAGGVFVEVPTRKVKPSQTCPNCSHQKEKTLAERTHICQKCGYTCDRDVAAAQVMLGWALGTSVLDGERQALPEAAKVRKHCGSLRQLGSLKRRKLPAL